jgi:dolichyl-phosphate beta-glucosyltransferase
VSPKTGPALSIVIPAYNEEQRLAGSLEEVSRFMGSWPGGAETIIVDDGSLDRTAAIACDFAARRPGVRVLVNQRNRGKGYSIRRGFLEARGETVLLSDADLSTPLGEAAKLIQRLEALGGGIVIGSRGLESSNVEVRQNPIREGMGRIFNILVRAITKLPYKDTQCGFKVITMAIGKKIFERARVDGFSYDVELLYVAHQRGIPIDEVPVTWRNAPGSKVGMISAPILMLRDVARVVRWHREGWYDAES